MQPYSVGDDNKGLFTFYRQQAEFDQGPTGDAKSIKQILERVQKKRNTQIQSVNRQSKDKTKISKHLSVERNQNHRYKLTSRNTVDIHTVGLDPNKNSSHISTQGLSQQKNNSPKALVLKGDKDDQFLKYKSELECLRLKKKKIYVSQNQNSFTERTSKDRKQNKIKDQGKAQASKQSKIVDYFKRLALEPKQFEGIVSTDAQNKQMNMLKKRKQKKGLKSYRKQKNNQKDPSLQKSQYLNNKKSDKLKQLSFEKKRNLDQIKVDFEAHKQNTKLIRVEKLQDRKQDSNHSLNKKQIASILPLISQRTKIQKQDNPQLRYDMSIELLNSYNLRNKYKIRKMDQQNLGILSHNQGLREKQKLSKPTTIKHNISLKCDSLIKQPSTSQIDQTEKIFCNKNQYLKNYSKMLKGHSLGSKQQDKQDNAMLTERKQKLMVNLMQNLNF